MTGLSDRSKSAVYPLREVVVPRPRVAPLLGALLLGGGVGLCAGAALQLGLVPVVAMSITLAVVAVCIAFASGHRARIKASLDAANAPRIALDATSITLVDGNSESLLLRIDRPFGATLLATPARDALVLALTHRDGVAFLAGRAPSGAHRTDLLARAITTPESDLPLERTVPTFDRGDHLLDIVAELEARHPGALDRVFLSDAGMADVVLDGRKLRAGQLDFDLRVPLRWRAYGFQEGSTFAANSYQATMIRQGDREVVLVALAPTGELATAAVILPTGTGPRIGPLAFEEVQRALARDLRLARGLADMPPPRAQRVAVDRLFMPRLRAALDLAPAERIATPAPGVVVPAEIPPEALQTPPDGIEQLRSSRP
jgi:hypothetical protein